MSSKNLGELGEKIVAGYLRKQGYKILGRNYKRKWLGGPQRGEIDIIAKKGGVISFVEVKSVNYFSEKENFSPEQKVNSKKQKKLIQLAQIWLSEKNIPLESKWQIDVISVSVNFNLRKSRVRHFKNAICE